MNLDALRIFVNSVKLGSFAAVARQMDIDPSTVSRAISNLEHELGIRILQRTTRKLVPTEAGTVYFERVQGLLDAFEIAGQEVQDMVSDPKGTIRVSACTSFGPRVLVPLLPRLTARYPQLKLDLRLSDQKIDIVKEKIDLAIRFGPKPNDNVISTRLNARRFSICASPNFIRKHGRPATVENLSHFDCVVFKMPGKVSSWRFRGPDDRVTDVTVSGTLITSHGLTMTAAAVEGLGIAMLPDWACSKELQDGKLVDLFPNVECTFSAFDTAAWLVYPKGNYLPLKVRKLIEFLMEEIGEIDI